MAHKGRDYKLWFRRDFWNVRNYRDAAPEAYHVRTLAGVSSSFWNLNPVVNNLAYNTRVDDSAVRQWTSDKAGSTNNPVRWRFIVEDETWEDPKVCRFQILVNADFRIFDIRIEAFNRTSVPREWFFRRRAEVLIRDTGILFTESSFELDVVYTGYDRYNP